MNAQMALNTYRTAGVASEIEGASPFRLVQILMEKVLEKLNLSIARADQATERREAVTWPCPVHGAGRRRGRGCRCGPGGPRRGPRPGRGPCGRERLVEPEPEEQ